MAHSQCSASGGPEGPDAQSTLSLPVAATEDLQIMGTREQRSRRERRGSGDLRKRQNI